MSITTHLTLAGDSSIELFDYPGAGANYPDVQTDDGFTSYVDTGDGDNWKRDLYTTSGSPFSTAGPTINWVKITISCVAGLYPVVSARPVLKTNDTEVNGTTVYPAESPAWTQYSQTWTVNPVTGVAWTWAEVAALIVGVGMKGAFVDVWQWGYCTMVYAEVNCEEEFNITGGVRALTLATVNPTVTSILDAPVGLVVGAYQFSSDRILDLKRVLHDESDVLTVLLNNSDGYLTDLALKGQSIVAYARDAFGSTIKRYAPFRVVSQDYYSASGALLCELSCVGIPNLLSVDKADDDFDNASADTNTVKSWVTAVLAGPSNTITTTHEQTAGSSEFEMSLNGYLKAGQVITPTAPIIGFGIKIKKTGTLGSTEGNLVFVVRKWSDGSLLGSKVWGPASNLTGSMTLRSVTFDTPIDATGIKVFLGIELSGTFSGGGNTILVAYANTSQVADEDFGSYCVASGWEEWGDYDAVYYYYYQGFTIFNHCQAYETIYDSEDSFIDVYCPKDSLQIDFNESRLSVVRKLLDYTQCKMRFEDDGKVHILQPTTSEETYDVEYELSTLGVASEKPFYDKTIREGLVIPNKVSVESKVGDSPPYSGTATDAASYAAFPITEFVRTTLASDDQAESIAEAMISSAQLNAQRGSIHLPMYSMVKLWNYIKITDARQSDSCTGNIAQITEHYKPGGSPCPWEMTLSFGKPLLRGIAGTRPTLLNPVRQVLIQPPEPVVTPAMFAQLYLLMMYEDENIYNAINGVVDVVNNVIAKLNVLISEH